jgi:hypothetical protein
MFLLAIVFVIVGGAVLDINDARATSGSLYVSAIILFVSALFIEK